MQIHFPRRGSPLSRNEEKERLKRLGVSRHKRFTHRQMSKRERRARRKAERQARKAGRR